MVILVAPNERKARIEVGMGLESEITNDKADTIMHSDMLPYFSKGDYSKGIYRGVSSTATLIAQSYGTTLTTTANVCCPVVPPMEATIGIKTAKVETSAIIS